MSLEELTVIFSSIYRKQYIMCVYIYMLEGVKPVGTAINSIRLEARVRKLGN